ncbi:MAG: leucine--tRNA ligase [Proteobacteria bacterium]|nr:leucine--tRNA ligase [Pseudomonadota bacterium]
MKDRHDIYDFAAIESKWQKWWQDHEVYKVDIDPHKPKYYTLDMFPYPSGAGLHVGHPLGFIASDIIARYKTLQGYNVLHPMGFDAFGLPAEQYAIETGQHPAITTKNNIERYKKQLKRMGLSYDWSREIRTCDSSYYHWTQWAFIGLFQHWFDKKLQKARPIEELKELFARHGTHLSYAATHSHDKTPSLSADEWQKLNSEEQDRYLLNYRLAYQEEASVNWCEALGTVLANDEIQDGLSVRGGHPVTQKNMKQWKLRITAYAERLLSGLDSLDWSESMKTVQRNWIGKSHGMDIHFPLSTSSHSIQIYTTRADTIYGVTFLVLAPEHPLVKVVTTHEQKASVEKYLNRTAQKLEAPHGTQNTTGVLSGSFAIHPLTGHKIPIWISDYVLMDYGHGAIMAVPADDERDRKFAQCFNLPIIENHTVGTPLESCSHTQEAIEKIYTILTNTDSTTSKPKRRINYKIKDAIFARQRYWGEPIPIYYKNHIPYPLPLKDLPLLLPDIDSYHPTPQGDPPLARADHWTNKHGHPLETNTMPGFAGSSAYFLRYCDPHNTHALASKEALSYWQNVDLYIGGSEHATGHLIYARFWHMFLHDIDLAPTQEPFQKMINQGMILGTSQYAHRSKGTNTFISYDLTRSHDTQRIPVDIRLFRQGHLDIEAFKAWRSEYATATFQCNNNGHFLCEEVVEKMSKSLFNTMSPDEVIDDYGADTLRLYEMFLGPIEQTKPWSVTKIEGVHRFLKRFWRLFFRQGEWHVSDEELTDKELTLLHKTIYEVRRSTENYQFNTAISAMMSVTNILTRQEIRKYHILKPLTILLAPYAPHIAEELYARLESTKVPSLFKHGKLPDYNEDFLLNNTWNAPVAINGKVKFTLPLQLDENKESIQKQIQQHEKFHHILKGKAITKWIIIPNKMINIVTKK